MRDAVRARRLRYPASALCPRRLHRLSAQTFRVRDFNADAKLRTCPKCSAVHPPSYGFFAAQDTVEEHAARSWRTDMALIAVCRVDEVPEAKALCRHLPDGLQIALARVADAPGRFVAFEISLPALAARPSAWAGSRTASSPAPGISSALRHPLRRGGRLCRARCASACSRRWSTSSRFISTIELGLCAVTSCSLAQFEIASAEFGDDRCAVRQLVAGNALPA